MSCLSRTRDGSRLLLLAVFIALVAVGVAAGGPASASAAPVTAPACVDDSGLPVPAGALTLSDAQQEQLRAGAAIPLYDTYGVGRKAVPFCTVRLVDGALRSAWSYCTDSELGACFEGGVLARQPSNRQFADDPLGADKARVIAQLVQHPYVIRDARALGVDDLDDGASSGERTAPQRRATQMLVWCVSDAPPGQRTVDSPGCRANFGDDDFAAVLDQAPPTPLLAVEREGAEDVASGSVVRFRVTTTIVDQPIALQVTGGTPSVCEGDAEIRGGTLVVGSGAAPGSVVLCVPAGASTTEVALSATAPDHERIAWYWNGRADCQVFAEFETARGVPLATRASARTQLPPQPPVNPPTEPPTEPPTVTPPAVAGATAERIDRLGLSKTPIGRTSRLRAGSVVRWRLRVTNPSRKLTVRDVRVCDTLPAGARFVRASPKARLSDGRRCWTIRTLAPRATRTFTITARILRGSPARLTNRASAVSIDARRTAFASSTLRVRVSKPRPGGVTG